MTDEEEERSSESGDGQEVLDVERGRIGSSEPSLESLIREDDQLVNILKAEISRRDLELESIRRDIRSKEGALREMQESVDAAKQLHTLFLNFTSTFHNVDQHPLTLNIAGADAARTVAKNLHRSVNSAHRRNLEASTDIKIFLKVVTTWMTEATADLDVARDTLDKKEDHITDIKKQISVIQSRMSQRLACFNPVWRLPNELWTIILSHALPRTVSSDEYLERFREEWDDTTALVELKLASVCCRWRDILHATPEVWNTIYIPSRTTDKDIARIRHYYSLGNKSHLCLLIAMEHDVSGDKTGQLLTLFRRDIICRSVSILTSLAGKRRVADLLHFLPLPSELRMVASCGNMYFEVILPIAFGSFIRTLYLSHCRVGWTSGKTVELEELGIRSNTPDDELYLLDPNILKSLKKLALYPTWLVPVLEPPRPQRSILPKLAEVTCSIQFLVSSLTRDYKLPSLRRLVILSASEYELDKWEQSRREVEETSRIQEIVFKSMDSGHSLLLSMLLTLQDLRLLQLEGSTVDAILVGWPGAWSSSRGARGAFPPLMDLIVEKYKGNGEGSLLEFVEWHHTMILHQGRKLRVTLWDCPNITPETLARLSLIAEVMW